VKNNQSVQETFMHNLQERLARVHQHCKNYQTPQLRRSIGQTIITLGLYAVLSALIMWMFHAGYGWFTPLVMVPAAGMLVKVFIIQHDCGHGSYFKSKTLNTRVGQLMSVLTFTPFAFWRDAHNKHHASSGNLSRRGIGAIDTLTKAEFDAMTPGQQRMYRFYRHPLIMFFIGPPLYILIIQRFSFTKAVPLSQTYQTITGSHLLPSVLGLNFAMLVFYGALAWLFGLDLVLLTFLPVGALAAVAGGWLFYVQHQYEDSYWADDEEWDYKTAALLGSSHYDLPKVLHWVTGNIGYHHIHHLSSLIPNYRLAECYNNSSDLQLFPRMSLKDSLKTVKLRLWDENAQKMVGF